MPERLLALARLACRAGVLASLIYSQLRVVIDLIATSRGDQASLQAEVLMLRRHVQVLERQVKRVRWNAGDRMLLAALRNRLLQSAWAGLLVRPQTVLGWHRAFAAKVGCLPQPCGAHLFIRGWLRV
jgi:hypothetical protein